MADHGGQPQLPGWITFGVDELTLTAAAGPAPLNILNPTQPFTLTVAFTGNDTIWHWLETVPGIRYHVHFYAERIGYGSIDFPVNPATDEGLLVEGKHTYTVNHVVPANTLQEGLYRLGVAVTFPRMPNANPPSPGVPYVAGFYEGLVIQATPQA